MGLLDADIYGPNVPIMMGVSGTRGRKNKIVPLEGYGVKGMSMGFLVPEGQPLIWRGPMLHGAIRQFLHDSVAAAPVRWLRAMACPSWAKSR